MQIFDPKSQFLIAFSGLVRVKAKCIVDISGYRVSNKSVL